MIGIHAGVHLLIDGDLARDHLDTVDDQPLHRRLDIHDLELQSGRGDRATVGVLAAGFGIERSGVQHDLDHRTCGCGRNRGPGVHDAQHAGVGLEFGVTDERRFPTMTQLAVGLDVGGTTLLGLGIGLGPFALFGHQT